MDEVEGKRECLLLLKIFPEIKKNFFKFHMTFTYILLSRTWLCLHVDVREAVECTLQVADNIARGKS